MASLESIPAIFLKKDSTNNVFQLGFCNMSLLKISEKLARNVILIPKKYKEIFLTLEEVYVVQNAMFTFVC